jgi:hypothetical protein
MRIKYDYKETKKVHFQTNTKEYSYIYVYVCVCVCARARVFYIHYWK